MKKTIILSLAICLFYMFVSAMTVESLEIPSDAIRIRIIPNSNSSYDQKIKSKVKDRLETSLYDLLKDAENSDEAKKLIKNNLNIVEKDIENVFTSEKYNLGYEVSFGYNYFPKKKYKGVKYKEGYYESLLVTLGEGKGNNWWCVLYPPLCLIETDEAKNIEYKSFVKEILSKYFQ